MSQYTNFVEPLQDYFTPEELAAFSPSIIEAATIDGNLQLIPRHADISALYYRTDLFGDADLQAKFEEAYGYPLAPPTTLDQMYDMAEFFVGEGRRQVRHRVRRQGRGPRGSLLRAPLRQRRRLLRRGPQPHLRLRGGCRGGAVDAGPLRQRPRAPGHDQPRLGRRGSQLVQRRRGLLPRVVRLVRLLPGSRVLPQRGRQVRHGPRTGGHERRRTPAGPARTPSASPRTRRTRRRRPSSSSS